MHTQSPGPRAQAIQVERERWVPRGVSTYHAIYPVRAHGAELEDVDGNRYLDFAGGIGVMNVGHSHPQVVEAIQQQAARYTHTCAHVAMPELYVELARRLAVLVPGAAPRRSRTRSRSLAPQPGGRRSSPSRTAFMGARCWR